MVSSRPCAAAPPTMPTSSGPPGVVPFGTATLLSTGCCSLVTLALVRNWSEILRLNWELRFSSGKGATGSGEPLEGAPGTPKETTTRRVNQRPRSFQSMISVPFLFGLFFTMLVLGELNLFSLPLRYGTEPISSVAKSRPLYFYHSMSCSTHRGLRLVLSRSVATDRWHCVCRFVMALRHLSTKIDQPSSSSASGAGPRRGANGQSLEHRMTGTSTPSDGGHSMTQPSQVRLRRKVLARQLPIHSFGCSS